MSNVPDYLKSTIDLINRTFPDGIDEKLYFILLYLLYDHMSDENLSKVISVCINKKQALICNDIYKACNMKFDISLLKK